MKENKLAMYVAIAGIAVIGYMVYRNIRFGKDKMGEKDKKTVVLDEKKFTLAEWKKANEVSAALKGIKL